MATDPSSRRWWALYAAVAVAGVLPALRPGHVAGDGVDAFGSIWFFWWIRTCIEHLGDPSWTNLFFYPDGKNVFADTGNNFVDAVLAAPLAWVLGPLAWQPVWVVVVQLGNAATFRVLARELWGPGRLADAATLLWMVNPYVLVEITAGRPTQALLWFVPAAVVYLLRLCRAPAARHAVGLGVAVAMAGWTYWFTGFFLAALLLPLALAAGRRAPDRAAVARGVALSVAVCALLVLPAAVPMARAYAADLVPGAGLATNTPGEVANNVAPELHGLVQMETRGEPLFGSPVWALALLAALIWRAVEVPGGRGRWIAALLVTLLFGLGAGVPVGEAVIPNPPYVLLYQYLPFFDRLWFPYRFAAVAFVPAVVLVVGLWQRLGARGWMLAAFVAGSLGTNVARGTWPFRVHDARAPEPLLAMREVGGAVIVVPMGIQHDGLMWQTAFGLPTFGGMGESAPVFWPEGYRRRLKNPFVRALAEAANGRGRPFEPHHRAAIEDLGFRWVVLRLDFVAERGAEKGVPPEKARERAVANVEAAVGAPPVGRDERVAVWRLR